MGIKQKKKKIDAISKMSKAELQAEMVETILGSMMPLVEAVIRQRLKQCAEVIFENLDKKKGHSHD